MFRRTVLSTAVAVALGSSFASTAAYSNEDSVEKLEKIQVTGSRISRVDVEGATPVTVISREDIERSGQLTVADVLRSTTFNSFGSYSEQSGSSWQSQAFIDMRGLGASRTLVLLNGKRMPQSGARGDGAVNVNAIPAAAVESIEILTDGASAVYGSDAIGGVVNIILKDDFEGVNVTVGGANPKIDGGDEKKFSITGGQSNDDGNIMFAIEYDSKDIIFDRSYGPAQSDLSSGHGYSLYGRNIKGVNAVGGDLDRRALAGVDCSGSFATIGDECKYDYTQEKAMTAASERTQFVLNSNYFVTDSVEWSNELVFGFNKSTGIYAPAAGLFAIDGSTTGGAAILSANGFNPTGTVLQPGDQGYDPNHNGTMYYRFDDVGNRVTTVKDTNALFTSSLSGVFESAYLNDVEWNLAARYSKSYSDEKGAGYVLKSVAEDAVNSGDGFDAATGEFDSATTAAMTYDVSRDIRVTYMDINGGFQFDKGSIFGNDISWYVGAEASKQDYKDKYDSQSENGNVLGSAGNSSGGDRSQQAAFVETLIPLNDMVELNLAARYDNYSDFGSALSPKASIRFQPQDNLIVRGSVAKGFRAPGLTDLYGAAAEDKPFAIDYVQCRDKGISDCKANQDYNKQFDAIESSNPDLEAEESESFNIGLVYSPVDDLNLGVDYYNIKIENMVYYPEIQEIIDAELNGVDVSELIIRDSNGDIVQANIMPINAGQVSTSGIDLNADFTQYSDYGRLRYSVNGSYVIDYKKPEYFEGPISDVSGGYTHPYAYPEYRVNADIMWSSVDSMHNVAVGPRHVAGYTLNKGEADEEDVTSYTTWDIDYRVNLPWDGVAQVGVRNMFDRQAPLPTEHLDSMAQVENYSVTGRTIYASYSQNF